MFAGYTPSFCEFNVWILWKNAIGATAQAQCHSHCGPQPISRPSETGRGSEEIPTIHMENHGGYSMARSSDFHPWISAILVYWYPVSTRNLIRNPKERTPKKIVVNRS